MIPMIILWKTEDFLGRNVSQHETQISPVCFHHSIYQDLHHLPFFQLLDPLPQVLPQPHGQAMRAVGSQGQGKTQ
jgi:hypothetical protein